ncbi:MAG: hypothetical protein MJZ32_00520 [Bacteroidaceae bacterium]|nr:hypothetical protein [Bacteroidaceae bacterium]
MQIKKNSFVRRIVVTALTLFLSTGAYVSAQITTDTELFVVEKVDGSTIKIELSEKPVVSYDGRNISVVSADGTSFSEDFLFNEVRKFYYQAVNKPITPIDGGKNNGVSMTFVVDASSMNDLPTSVESVESIGNVLSFRFVDGENVVIAGVDNNMTISVIRADGAQVAASIDRNADVVNISLTGLQPGIYIIKVGVESFKVRVK